MKFKFQFNAPLCKWRIENGELRIENYGIFLWKMIEIVAKGDTFIINFQFSIINYLSGTATGASNNAYGVVHLNGTRCIDA